MHALRVYRQNTLYIFVSNEYKGKNIELHHGKPTEHKTSPNHYLHVQCTWTPKQNL